MIFPDFCFSFPFYVFFSSFRLFLLGKTHISRKENSYGLAIECVPWLLLHGCEDVTILFSTAKKKPTSISRKKKGENDPFIVETHAWVSVSAHGKYV